MTTALSLASLNSSWLTSDSYNLWPQRTPTSKQDTGPNRRIWQDCFATVHANKISKSEDGSKYYGNGEVHQCTARWEVLNTIKLQIYWFSMIMSYE